MIQPQPPKEEKGLSERLLRRLPRLGRPSQFLLVVGIFSILIITLWLVYQQQVPKRAELERTLATLQRTLAGAPKQETSRDALNAQIKSLQAQTEAARTVFSTTSQGPEMLDKLIKTAQVYDISITRTDQSTSSQIVTIGANKVTFPVLTFSFDLKGQVPDFQNFLLALGSKLPTSQIKEITITPAVKEGEQSKATVKIDVFCYGGK